MKTTHINNPGFLKKTVRYNFYIITCFVVVLLTSLIYYQSLKNPFANWDDTDYITLNKDIRTLHDDSITYSLKKTFSSYTMGNYHPITMLSYSIEYNFFQLRPTPYHVTNLILHISNALLVYLFIWLLIRQKWTAFFTALLFAIHPMHVESVVWVSERKDLLYSFFLLLSLSCYIKYSDAEKNKGFYYSVTMITFILSVLSKGMAVCIPLLFILIDYFRSEKISKKLIIEKIPFLLISLAFGIIAILAQKSSNSITLLTTYSFFERILFSSYGLLLYLYKLIIPSNLSCFYPYPILHKGFYPFIFYIAPLLVGFVGYLIFKSLKFGKDIFFGFAFFIITIALVLQILPVGGAIVAERYTYLPYIGLFFLIGLFMNAVIENKIPQLVFIKIPILISVGIICLVFSILAYKQTKVWQNNISLWQNVINKNAVLPDWVQTNLRISYTEKADANFTHEKYDLAIIDFNKYIALKKDNPATYFKRDFCYYKLKRNDEAINDFSLAIKYSPNYAEAYFNRGMIYFEKGVFENAISDFTKAIEVKPDYYEVYYNRGIVFNDMKRYKEVIDDYTYFLSHRKNDPDALYNRSGAYYLSQQYNLALTDALEAEKAGFAVDPEYIEALKKMMQ